MPGKTIPGGRRHNLNLRLSAGERAVLDVAKGDRTLSTYVRDTLIPIAEQDADDE